MNAAIALSTTPGSCCKTQRGLRRADMAGHGPNDENRRDGIDQGEQQAAVEGGRRPQRRRCLQPKGARKQRPVRHAFIAEKPLDPVEESGQPFRIEPCREIAPGEARAQLVIVLPLDRPFRQRPLRQKPEIIFINEWSEGNAKAVDARPQSAAGLPARSPPTIRRLHSKTTDRSCPPPPLQAKKIT